MKRILRLTGFGLLGVFVLALIGAGTLLVLGNRKLSHVYDVEGKAVPTQVTPETLARGEHLVRSVSGCADCHGSDLGGQVFLDDPSFATLYASNLTAGQGGAAKVYTDADWERALRSGVGHDGRALAPMMPSEALQHLSDADLAAVVAYLRSLPPVDNAMPEPVYAPLARLLTGAGAFPLAPDLVAKVKRLEPSPDIGVTAHYGHYLASVAGCTTCHGATLTGGEHPAHPGLQTPNLVSRAATWDVATFGRALRTGQTPDGKVLDLELMPWPVYTGMTDDEVAALWLYLKSLTVAAEAP